MLNYGFLYICFLGIESGVKEYKVRPDPPLRIRRHSPTSTSLINLL